MNALPTLRSHSAANDAAWLAAADVADIAAQLVVPYRLIGGIAVTLLAHALDATQLAPMRETADADMGVSLDVIGDERLLAALTQRGYTQMESNRFTRSTEGRDLVIDVLAPSYVGELVTNQAHGALIVDEVPGLILALRLEPVEAVLSAVLSDGSDLPMSLLLPDVRAMLVLKAFAYRGRVSDDDALDIWRLLEAANAVGITAADWPTGADGRDGARLLHTYFAAPGSGGPARAAEGHAAQARIRALTHRVVPGVP